MINIDMETTIGILNTLSNILFHKNNYLLNE